MRSILTFARSLKLAAIVEGVETERQLAELRRLRCVLAQGFLFAEPLPADDLTRLLADPEAVRSLVATCAAEAAVTLG